MKETLLQRGLRAKAPEAIDSSMLGVFARCPSKFYLRHVLGLQQKSYDIEKDAPLDWGTMWHKLMEVYGQTGDPAEALAVLNDWPDSIVGETDRHGRSKQRMAEIFFDYLEKFGDRDKNVEILRHEQFFDLHDEDVGLRWCGRMDRIVKENGEIYPKDFKTTSWLTSTYFERYTHSFQLPGYVWAAQQLLGEPVRKIQLDVLHTLKREHKFYRRLIVYTQPQIDEWVENTKRYLKEMEYLLENHLWEPEAWRKNWNACTDFNRVCQFGAIHFTSPTRDTRLRILEEDFVEDRWNPNTEGD